MRAVGAQATRSSEARTRLDAFATGFNLPGVADVPVEQSRMPSAEVVARFVDLGFRSVRLPVEPRLAASAGGDDFLENLRHAIGLLLGAGASVTLDLHPDIETDRLLGTSPARGAGLVVAAWDRLAPLVAATPADRVMPELLNEPALSPDAWRDLRQDLVRRIRRTVPDHTLVWGAAANQTIEETVADGGPDDGNAVAAVHYYYPMIFTHQGQHWGDSPLGGVVELPFPFSADHPAVVALRERLASAGDEAGVAAIDVEMTAPWTATRIAEDFAALAEWSRASGWPVIVNEFGVLRDHALPAARARWLAAVSRAAEANGFGWCHWEFDEGFGFTRSRGESGEIDAMAVAALLGGEP